MVFLLLTLNRFYVYITLNRFPFAAGLFIKPEIQGRGTEWGECGERGEYSLGLRGIS